MGFLASKKLLITGVLSNRSVAYGVAKACHQQGPVVAAASPLQRHITIEEVGNVAAFLLSDLASGVTAPDMENL